MGALSAEIRTGKVLVEHIARACRKVRDTDSSLMRLALVETSCGHSIPIGSEWML